jgi:hypothetical protein
VHLEHRWQFWGHHRGRGSFVMDELPFAHARSPSSLNAERICLNPAGAHAPHRCHSYHSPSTISTLFKPSPFVVYHCSTIGFRISVRVRPSPSFESSILVCTRRFNAARALFVDLHRVRSIHTSRRNVVVNATVDHAQSTIQPNRVRRSHKARYRKDEFLPRM